ncbi:transcriptional regulator BetI [Cypionkella aquatica]|uniref:Transcriptional regulator BetI n=1 Tax=Cypionkella aquatica TaxID=1756042 RepID=A0AA37U2U9_9RHOB|nr:transcriptional regulator BetI [Cypionkella aquatica]GLS86274.1 transcriptional regulator BetI [Cypionkella aquatica]
MTKIAFRTRIEDLRRRELIEAAHRVFMQHGLGGMTTKRICEEAGMSAGILSYYFKGKEDVLFAMVRLNNRVLMEAVATGLAQATTRWGRLEAIIAGNFPEGLFEPNIANAWLSVCAASSTNIRYVRLQRIFYARLQSNLASVFRDVLADARFKQIALALGTMIDGLWLRRATGEALISTDCTALVLSVAVALLTEAEQAQLQAA